MSLSTVFMPCDADGVGPVPFPPSNAARWGIADFDWSNGFNWYARQQPMNCEETLLAQAEAVHALNPAAHQFVYRNAIKALPWFTSVRALLEDRSKWGWFLPFANCSAHDCGPNATQNLYHDESLTPRGDCGAGVACGEYLFDLRVPQVQDWLAGEYILGPTGLGSGAVRGFYFDDNWGHEGPSEMAPGAVAAIGLSPADVAALVAASELMFARKINATLRAGGFVFDLLNAAGAPETNATSAPATCAAFLADFCGADGPAQRAPLLLELSRVNHTAPWPLPFAEQNLATFLLARGDYAWIGYTWSNCHAPDVFVRPPTFDVDYGEPVNFCSQTAPASGVFTRNYTRADVALDCNSYTASIQLKGK